jgi:hypothetical protein
MFSPPVYVGAVDAFSTAGDGEEPNGAQQTIDKPSESVSMRRR